MISNDDIKAECRDLLSNRGWEMIGVSADGSAWSGYAKKNGFVFFWKIHEEKQIPTAFDQHIPEKHVGTPRKSLWHIQKHKYIVKHGRTAFDLKRAVAFVEHCIAMEAI